MNSRRGSVLLEGTLCLPPLLFAVLLNVELVLRARQEILLQHGAFLFARARALGGSQHEARRTLGEFYRAVLGQNSFRAALESTTVTEAWKPGGLEIKLHRRYPILLAFPLGKGMKHHFEITRVCRFPLSW